MVTGVGWALLIGGALVLLALALWWLLRLVRTVPVVMDPVDRQFLAVVAALWLDDDRLPPADCPCVDCERERLPRWRRVLTRRSR